MNCFKKSAATEFFIILFPVLTSEFMSLLHYGTSHYTSNSYYSILKDLNKASINNNKPRIATMESDNNSNNNSIINSFTIPIPEQKSTRYLFTSSLGKGTYKRVSDHKNR